MTVALTEPGGSSTMVRVGNGVYPLYVDPNCHTCQSPHRMFIENQLVQFGGYAAIARQVLTMPKRPGWPPPSARSIARHVKNKHVISPALIRRIIAEQRASDQGLSLYEADTILTKAAYAELVMYRAAERMNDGEVEPSIRDGLDAARFLQTLEGGTDQQSGFTQEIWEAIFFTVYDVMSRELIPEDFQRVADAINRNPMIQALMAKAQQKQQHPTVAGQSEDGEDPSQDEDR